ncbi:Rpn family recombination-promoting nuclease/putative transposase [Drancourtella massiliensis]|uniref:Rpn family recombination-promoting nuclease/putative transposase n=1 Tax=Drancourtella massiliensis TaxID=1632013 RepID=A0ABS2EKJ8_9FIRM|nr:Rpn family recombination-promoting nuclease/putative transposase [Drancourtella massiliensis]MBM6745563.1 Rpn family recombination-promoting nuclease/putative transposase [Drancourtella massiliensis]
MQKNKIKPLKDLRLLDRFLFAELMEDEECSKEVLEIILGKEISLLSKDQTEKEIRTATWLKSIRLDVYSVDEEGTVYDTEMQQNWRDDLEKRSRYYQGLLDSSLLVPGEQSYNALNDTYIIMIMPFDLFRKGRYQYTIKAFCEEDKEIQIQDGATRIFLNTHGKNKEEIRPELIEFLNYVEKTNELQEETFRSEKVTKIQKAVRQIKSNEEIGVKYMQKWEEIAEARAEGRTEGREEYTLELIRKKQEKGKSLAQIAEDLEMTEEEVQSVLERIREESEEQ